MECPSVRECDSNEKGCCVEVAMLTARCPPMGDAAATGAREMLKELTSAIDGHFGSGLLGLYLFGSLAAGAFYPGKSDLDLMAIVAAGVEEVQLIQGAAEASTRAAPGAQPSELADDQRGGQDQRYQREREQREKHRTRSPQPPEARGKKMTRSAPSGMSR